jgi:hypothetical protein
MTNAQIFTELTGGCWHEPIFYGSRICIHCGVLIAVGDANKPFYDMVKYNPTYSNAADILNRMREFVGEDKYKIFGTIIGLWTYDPFNSKYNLYVGEKYVTDPPVLLERAIEFLQEADHERGV